MVTDGELSERAAALRQEAGAVLADLEAAGVLDGIGSVHLTGSYVSGLMVWRDLDVMVHVGPSFSPHFVNLLSLLFHLIAGIGEILLQSLIGREHTTNVTQQYVFRTLEFASNLQASDVSF